MVHYQRMGACCVYETEAAEQGKGFLDLYRLSYEGLAEPLDIYLNMFSAGTPQVPRGFSFAPVPATD